MPGILMPNNNPPNINVTGSDISGYDVADSHFPASQAEGLSQGSVQTSEPGSVMASSHNYREHAYQEHDYQDHVANLPTVNPSPQIAATIRRQFSDFRVTEILSFEPSGEGEHLFLYIEKNRCNTDWVANQLQRHFQLRSQDIGYAGKKDRYSISCQWFSLHIPGKDVLTNDLDNEFFRVVKVTRHSKKLRKGSIRHNRFQIRVCDLSGEIKTETINSVTRKGFPNYFGYQRFGHHGNNLRKAGQLFNGEIKVRSRNKKGLYISAARSFLFNLSTAQRLKRNTWDKVIDGDCLNLAGTQSYFTCDKVDRDIEQRLEVGDIHISGWLAGKQLSQAKGPALAVENEVMENHSSWLTGLTKAKVSSARRPMRVIPEDLKITTEGEGEGEARDLLLEFSLPAGSFATSLLRELFVVTDESLGNAQDYGSKS